MASTFPHSTVTVKAETAVQVTTNVISTNGRHVVLLSQLQLRRELSSILVVNAERPWLRCALP